MVAALETIPERIGETVLRRVERDDPVNAQFVGLYADAYTALDLGDQEKRERFERRLRETAEEQNTVRIAAYRNGTLVGAMKWFDFTMRLRDRDVLAGGLGSVAVALDARRRGIGHDLVRAFIETYHGRGATIALLHPFRHDFYYAFGFGHGTKMNEFRLSPQTLPARGDPTVVRQVGSESAGAIASCYERVRVKGNGLIVTPPEEFVRQLDDPTLRAFAAVHDGAVSGFIFARPFVEHAQNPNTNALRVFEPMAETPDALLALLAFLRGLGDQFRAIVIQTQNDAFYLVPSDARNGSGRIVQPPAYHETNVQGAGVMYRVLDPREVFAAFGGRSGGALRVVFDIDDPFLAGGGISRELAFDDGGPLALARLTLGVAEFSSLAVGSVGLRSLYELGLAGISDPAAVRRVDRALAAPSPPLCTTRF
ncbi:MAG: GNAT family N-acetyltransferase [Candidatus Eremiobacteraeota bacterium]|nr:GNAT family N-acetyltransferase [Candidatus Eremiobacteraeota bacterium]